MEKIANLCLLIFLAIASSFATVQTQDPFFKVPKDIPTADYRAEVRIDLNKKLISGNVSVNMENSGKIPLEVIAFDCTLDDYSAITVFQGNLELSAYNPMDQDLIHAPVYFVLENPVLPLDSLHLTFNFKKRLGITDTQPESLEFRDDLFPELWWDGLPVASSYSVKIGEVPGYNIAAGGRLNKETGYYENQMAKDFGLVLLSNVEKMTGDEQDVQINVFYPEKGEQVANLAMETAREAIQFYTGWMGSYPYSFLNIIPGGSGPWGGFPFSSGMVIIHGMQAFDEASERHWKWITAHEIGHQYWGEYVLEGNRPDWLWISLGIYMDWQFSQHVGLSDVKHRNWVDMYLKGAKRGYNTAFDLREDELAAIEFDRNNYVIHAKGFAFIAGLELVMGKDVFNETYLAAYNRYGGKRLNWYDFKTVCEETCGTDLTWFFDAWVRSSQFPASEVYFTKSRKQGDQFHSTVAIRQVGEWIMPLPVTAYFEDGTSQAKLTNRMGRICKLEFTSDAKLAGASVDPSGTIAHMNEMPEMNAEQVIQKIRELPYSGAGSEAYRVYRMTFGLEDRSLLKDNWFRLGMALFDAGYSGPANYAFENATYYGEGVSKFAAYAWIGNLHDINGERSKAVQAYEAALEVNDDYTMTHSQYGIQIDRNWLEKRMETPFTFKEKL